MENFVTLFDNNYVSQGIALHRSLERVMPEFHLWIVAVDDKCFNTLEKIKLTNTTILRLSSLITPELINARKNRTNGEFCWTLTPFVFDFVFNEDPRIERVTYLDADVWFRKSPKLIFEKFDYSQKSVLITDHGYAPEHDQSSLSGQYCVQFLCFMRVGSEVLRDQWKKQCLSWCFNRVEDGKFGDQKYLDNWPTEFPSKVYILDDHSLLLAPWNATRFPYGNSVLWHFHGFKFSKDGNNQYQLEQLWPSIYLIPDVVRENVYKNYVNDIDHAIKLVELNEAL
jgi:hypothetical protein